MYAGYIKIHRQLLEWEWYGDTNTMRVFLHLLLSANWKNGMFKGVEIPRGNLVTSLSKLSQALSLTERQIRTAIEHLKKSRTIAVNILKIQRNRGVKLRSLPRQRQSK